MGIIFPYSYKMGQRLIYEEIGGSGDIRDVSTTNPLPVQTIGGGSSSAVEVLQVVEVQVIQQNREILLLQ